MTTLRLMNASPSPSLSRFNMGIIALLFAIQSLAGSLSGQTVNNSTAISAWGDSLTFGNQDGSGYNYPAYLQGGLNRLVKNYGIGGTTSTQILTRFRIATTSYDDFTVIWSGRNDPAAGISTYTTLANISSMVSALPTSNGRRYLVMPVINDQNEPAGSSSYTNLIRLDTSLSSTYGGYDYLDIRELLVGQFNPANGADVLNHSQDMVPVTLRAITSSGKLTAAVSSTTSCAFNLNTNFTLAVGDLLLVGSEYIVMTAFTGTNVTACTRGYGSTAATYSSGTAYQLIDHLHLGPAGLEYVASQLKEFITANDNMAGSSSSFFPADQINNTVLGSGVLSNNTTGNTNTGVGLATLHSNTTGSFNDGYGYESLSNNTTGIGNDGYGTNSLFTNVAGSYNSAFGVEALYSNTGSYNASFGYGSLLANTTGSRNDAFGYETLFNNTTGADEEGFGHEVLYSNTTGSYSTGIGHAALYGVTTGNGDTGIGYQAGFITNALTTGSYDTFLGYQATSGSPTQQSYMTVIGASATGACSNCVILGRKNTDSVYIGAGVITTPYTITASAAPALIATNGLQMVTLSANATPTISGIVSGQRITFEICQPASGGPYTWTWPASVHGGVTTIGGMSASTCAIESFDSFNGTTLVAENAGVTGVAP